MIVVDGYRHRQVLNWVSVGSNGREIDGLQLREKKEKNEKKKKKMSVKDEDVGSNGKKEILGRCRRDRQEGQEN